MGSGAAAGPPADRRAPMVPGRHRIVNFGRIGAVAWLLATPLALAAGAHLTGLDQRAAVPLLVAGLIPALWAVALVPLAVGLATRRRALAGLSAAVLLLDLAWAVAGLGLPRAPTPAADAGPGLRLFSANLRYDNPRIGAVADELGRAGADVVALTELSQANLAGLGRSGALAAYPRALAHPRGGAFGIGLWSRLPLVEGEVVEVAGVPVLRATLLVGGRRLRLYVVHTVAPLGPDRDRWRRQLAWLAGAVVRERDPVVVAGDLNATRWHRGLSRLLALGLDDAHERRGRGWAATWPSDRRPLPPLLRLDHVLVSPQVGVRAVAEGAGPGSDHLPVLADLVLTVEDASGREADGLPSRHGPLPLRPATSAALPLRPSPRRPRALPPRVRLRPLRPRRLLPLPAPLVLAALTALQTPGTSDTGRPPIATVRRSRSRAETSRPADGPRLSAAPPPRARSRASRWRSSSPASSAATPASRPRARRWSPRLW
jgi:endonuclease/exonuclease/phosphatase (EEP) superfamily protein YafD